MQLNGSVNNHLLLAEEIQSSSDSDTDNDRVAELESKVKELEEKVQQLQSQLDEVRTERDRLEQTRVEMEADREEEIKIIERVRAQLHIMIGRAQTANNLTAEFVPYRK
jgi:septal ring factor EnvC (AmiA/AmiB activator)